jgi:hypothetical protein
MKKFLIVVIAAVLSLAVAMPAVAKIQMGGLITLDSYYYSRSEDNVNGGTVPGDTTIPESISFTRFNLPQAFNRLEAKYTSDDGVLGGFIQLRGGAQTGFGGSYGNQVVWNYAWIDWRFNPNVYLRVGRQTQAFAIKAPQQYMGQADAHIVGAGFGNVHGATSRDAIRLYWKFNDMVRMELQALDPDSDPTGASVFSPIQPVSAGTVIATESNPIPRFDLAIPITVGGFSIEPSFTWSRQEFNQVREGDDSFDCIAGAIGFGGGIGPVILGGEFTYGRNLGAANYAGAANWAPTYFDSNANGIADTVEDTTGYAWWFHLGFKAGPATIFGIVGNNKTDNDGNPAISDVTSGGGDVLEFDLNRWMYGLAVPISVAKGFTIRPEFFYYDYDGSGKAGGIQGRDFGNQWLLGIQWQLKF